jgi:hypothetical protein
MPISVLQLHLKVMHDFIRFHYGPHWCLQVQGNNVRNSKSNRLITLSEIQVCLSQLPFLYGYTALRSCDSLCCCEQVQVSEDLRLRLTENMTRCCQSCFIHQHHQHRPFLLHNHYQDTHISTTSSTWSLCYLFAREKIVAQSHNDPDLLSNEFIYFLKLLVSQYLQESCKVTDIETENNVFTLIIVTSQYHHYHHHQVTTSLPQNISTSTK